MGPRNDVAIYSPYAFLFYEDPAARPSGDQRGGGGAELQTTLLARALAQQGMRVAHIVYPVASRASDQAPNPEVIERPARSERRDLVGKLGEAPGVWRALAAADARAYVFRTGLSGGVAAFLIGALFCLRHRRALVFAASSDLDFSFDREDRSSPIETAYRVALRRARCVVVQSEQQGELARAAVANPSRVVLIRSFAEPAEPVDPEADPDAFLWAGRVVDYKLPERYVELASAVPEARFLMIAATTGETTSTLSRQIDEAAAGAENLELLPRQPRARVLEALARAPAAVVTSRAEGMPNLFLEAWARGIAVLSLHFDPDGKLATDGLGIFAEGSWDRFVEGARRLWSDPALRREIGARGRQYVAREHSLDAVGARWAAALRAVLDSPR